MEPLTKQELEQAVRGLATKEDLAALATKADLGETEARLMRHAEELQADLVGMIERSVNASERMAKLENNMAEIRRLLRIDTPEEASIQ